MKVFLRLSVSIAVIGLVTAQYSNRSTKSKTNRNRNRDQPVEEGRTLGLLRPILGLGLSSVTRPLTSLGFDETIAPNRPYRPGSGVKPSGGSALSDPYGYGGYGGNGYGGNGYGGYGNSFGGFGGLLSNIFGGYGNRPYNNYGGYQQQQYRPQYGGFNGGYPAYRPQSYRPQGNFGGFNGYPSNNAYGGQQAAFGGQQSGFGGAGSNNISPITGPSGPSAPAAVASPGAGGSQIDPAQAAQVANLLGQLLGSQLRPLLSQGGGAAASDVPGISPSRLAG